jgi:long-chain acyl-CoA synthetase
MHSAVEACCVTGANLGQPLALVMLNARRHRKAADGDGRGRAGRLAGRAPEEHQRDAGPARAARLPGAVTEPWTVDNDLITPTFKVKRNRIDPLTPYPELFAAKAASYRARWPHLGRDAAQTAPA